MKKVKITILASDILEGKYGYSKECAMTKAFRRAGLDIREVGGDIHSNWDSTIIMPTPEDLEHRVLAMYAWADRNDQGKLSQWPLRGNFPTPIEPADFDYELTIPD